MNISAELGAKFETSAQWFLVSRSGSRYRDLARDPVSQLVLISEDEHSETVYPGGQRPTTEWQCHKMLQKNFCHQEDPDRVVLHAHPASLILLSQQNVYSDPQALNQLLAEALPELPLFLPDGVATSVTAPPGSLELAQKSSLAIGDRKVLIWQGHGIVCIGKTVDQALDFMEVVEKAAQLVLFRFILTNFKV